VPKGADRGGGANFTNRFNAISVVQTAREK